MDKFKKFASLCSIEQQNAIKSIKTCYHPDCNEKSINSHILQKNGIISRIAEDNHVWEMRVNSFKIPPIEFKKVGINKVFSFNCFCNKHDTNLFKKIESNDIDFNDYESCLLLTVRSLYNERWRKEVNVKMFEALREKGPDGFRTERFNQQIQQEKLGVLDLKRTEEIIWNDINSGSQSFVFEHRFMEKLEICLSGFYNYETTLDFKEYRRKYGKDMPSTSPIFINLYPNNNSSNLLMGYLKINEQKVKPYFNRFFKEKEKRVQRLLSNLILFQIETRIMSNTFYNEKIKGYEDLFINGMYMSCNYPNERKNHNINIWKASFHDDFKKLLNSDVWEEYELKKLMQMFNNNP